MIKTCMTAATLLMISTSVIAADEGSILGEVRGAAGQTTTDGKTALGSATKPATDTRTNTQSANTGAIDGAAVQNKIDNQPNTNEQPAAGRHSDDEHRGHGKHGKDKHSHNRGKKGKHKGHDHDERKNRSRHDDDHHDNGGQSKHEENHGSHD
ncbi:MAG: hypothetical protein ABL865_01700 [Candidatus Nitrotoga sp.]